MKQVFRFDNSGFYLEPVVLKSDEEVPADCTDVAPPDGLFKAKFILGKWVETLSKEEIGAILGARQPLSETDQLKKQLADLSFELMMNGVI
jgi:hypothetical protein